VEVTDEEAEVGNVESKESKEELSLYGLNCGGVDKRTV